MDDEGYPTEGELERVRNWDPRDLPGLFAFLKATWWHAEWGWGETPHVDAAFGKGTLYSVSAGGWSGNEELLENFRENWAAWSQSWLSHRRGGHYEFFVKDALPVGVGVQGKSAQQPKEKT